MILSSLNLPHRRIGQRLLNHSNKLMLLVRTSSRGLPFQVLCMARATSQSPACPVIQCSQFEILASSNLQPLKVTARRRPALMLQISRLVTGLATHLRPAGLSPSIPSNLPCAQTPLPSTNNSTTGVFLRHQLGTLSWLRLVQIGRLRILLQVKKTIAPTERANEPKQTTSVFRPSSLSLNERGRHRLPTRATPRLAHRIQRRAAWVRRHMRRRPRRDSISSSALIAMRSTNWARTTNVRGRMIEEEV